MTAAISGATAVAGVIGDPVGHSLSPTIHNAAFRATGLDWAYLAFPVAAGQAAAAVAAVRALGLRGLSVTMPHKAAVLAALDEVSSTAAALRSVNTVHRRGEVLVGESTDGQGFVDALRLDEGFDPAGARCVVLGAGGAARAVILALAGAGAAEIVVVNRTAMTADEAARLAPTQARVGRAGEATGADLVVNATPMGMAGVEAGAVPLDPSLLRPGQVVADLVYHPIETPLLAAARLRGAVPVTGLGMLVHQAGAAFRLWTGLDPPLGAMAAAARSALESRAESR